MPGVYKVNYENNYVYKFLKKETRIGYLIYQSLKDFTGSRRINEKYFNFLIKNGHKIDYLGKHIVNGYLFKTLGNYYSPIVKGRLLSDININDLSIKESVHFLFSIEELLNSLRCFNKNIDKLIGDWSLHNLILCDNSGYIINIDLEGLYTYSKFGPELPWEKKENHLPFITGQFKNIQKSIITKCSKIKKFNKIPYISLIIINNIIDSNWLYPFYYNKEKPNMVNNIFYIYFGVLNGNYQFSKYSVYFIYKNQNKVTQLILKENEIPPQDAILFFKFTASINKGYEHPIPVKLVKKFNPLRTILKISENIGDFYINRFSK